MTEATLRDTILRIGEDARASAVAVAVYDFEHHTTWSINPARWFLACMPEWGVAQVVRQRQRLGEILINKQHA